MKFLVTGAAGFIGSFVAQRLCEAGHTVVGVDNLNDYYDVSLKQARLEHFAHDNFRFHTRSIEDYDGLNALFQEEQFDRVIHLAAQAGVRYSIDNPMAYGASNLSGFLSILECCRHHKIEHLVYASSSSVYGLNKRIPFSTEDNVDHPISLYAATKKSNELMAHSYSHLYQLPTTGLRFFTVYGPWGRPDMALFKFAKAILSGQSIDIYNHGDMQRDFTFIDDIVEAVVRIQDVIPTAQDNETNTPNVSATAPYRVFNIGHGSPVKLMDMVEALEDSLGVEAKKNFLPMQAGDVYTTFADTEDLFKAINFTPSVAVKEGIQRFVDWYKAFYQVQ
ncbi:NAD-dependent epimerase [Marinomonas fungiae]|uniref:NAD-dependent epimerase n=1 Tax=Marinomonas fungiae TaxID=1137284 RepID=UPI003A93F943